MMKAATTSRKIWTTMNERAPSRPHSGPLLEFRFGQKLVYPRDGLFLYGPVDGGRPEVHYGAIGTPAGLTRLEPWTGMVAGYENLQRKAKHFETLLTLLKVLAHAPEDKQLDSPLWRQRVDAAIAKAQAILAERAIQRSKLVP
jgi:hypothetical protein